jgi:hypothetical protein
MSEHEPEPQETDDEDDFEGQGFGIGGRADDAPDEPGPRPEEEADQS